LINRQPALPKEQPGFSRWGKPGSLVFTQNLLPPFLGDVPMGEASTSYDEVPYGASIFPYTHPDRLATLATLLGMQPPPVNHCRVLELGCGTGANLIPMAWGLPESHFLGIDLSSKQIAMGLQTRDALDLKNLDLQARSILDLHDSVGQFDYIICHGVYSWVPEIVQDKILDICSRNLAPAGVAYVSYNTFPGWHLRGMVREMMRFHVRQFSDPSTCVQQARALLDFLREAADFPNSLYNKVLEREAELLAEAPDTYVFHEHLEEVNHPLYFHEFMERASAKGLQYLAEAQPSLVAANLSPKVQATVQRMAVDLIHGEQYLDFVRNRTFRRTLLCHQDVQVRRPPLAQTVLNMQVTGLVKSSSAQPDLISSASEEFHDVHGSSISSTRPSFKLALYYLHQAWPQPMPFPELWRKVRTHLEQESGTSMSKEDSPEALAEALTQCFLADLVELHVHGPRFTRAIQERPVASSLARLQAEKSNCVPNLRHRNVELNDLEVLILRLLDGSRTQADLLQHLLEIVTSNEMEIQKDGQPIKDQNQTKEVLTDSLGQTLRHLAVNALLVEAP
jgi:methyltransferase-like protein/SAM-dependent methyltransferase